MKVGKLIRNSLIGIGVVCIIFVSFMAYMLDASDKFAQEHTAFIESYLTDLSVQWSVSDIHSRSTNQLLSQMNEAHGRAVIAKFNVLGKLKRIEEIEMMNYFTGTSGITGQFQLIAIYEGGPTLVKIVVIEKDEKVKVAGLHIKPIRGLPSIVTEREA